eukprot:3371894-Prymnesium_polylepis.1
MSAHSGRGGIPRLAAVDFPVARRCAMRSSSSSAAPTDGSSCRLCFSMRCLPSAASSAAKNGRLYKARSGRSSKFGSGSNAAANGSIRRLWKWRSSAFDGLAGLEPKGI